VTNLTRVSALDLVDMMAAGQATSVDIVSAHLDRIAEVEPQVGAFLHVATAAIEHAQNVDRRRKSGEDLPRTAGLPIAVKDVLCTSDMPTTAGSRILEGYYPPYDATVIRACHRAGLISLGKTNMDEFAMGSSTENSGYGPTHNPWDVTRTPGGSGGGSAAAVAALEAPLALGSDTGGSIRQPAAFTGTVGFKPTYGAVSRYGVIALASSLDQVGPVARSVSDAALLQDIISGHDPHDSTSIPDPWQSMLDAALEGKNTPQIRGLKVGRIKQLDTDGFQPGVRSKYHETLDLLANHGAHIVDIDAPHFDYAVSAYYLILPAEASSNLAKYDSVRFGLRVIPDGEGVTVEDVMAATREAGFGDEVKRRIILGTYALSAGYYDAYYGSAQKVRTLIQQDFQKAFAQVDVLATPAAPHTAPALGSQAADPMAVYANDLTTIPANLAGVPGLAIPMGLAAEDGLPVGLQLMAPARADHTLFRVGAAIETLIDDREGGPVWQRVPELSGKAAS